jgi:hypothetical protein
MMHPGIWLFAVPVVFLANCISAAQAPKKFRIVVPDSSVQRAQDRGVRAHTNHLIGVEAKPAARVAAVALPGDPCVHSGRV